jgi:hypothetical protein
MIEKIKGIGRTLPTERSETGWHSLRGSENPFLANIRFDNRIS